MATDLDQDARETVTELLEEFGGDYVFRKVLGTYSPAAGRSVSFASSGITINAADNSLNWAAGDLVAQGVEIGAWIYLSGSEKSGNDGWAKVLSISTTKAVLGKVLQNDSGALIGISLSIDYPCKAYITEWDRKYWNGSTIQSTDSMVMLDLNGIAVTPEEQGWLFYSGPDPAAAQEFAVMAVKPLYSGQLTPLAFVGVRR